MSLHFLFGLLCLGSTLLSRLDGASSGVDSNGASAQHVGENCDHHTTTTSQFDDYFDIDQIGNNRTDQNVVDLTLFVQVHNMQEELAILLSASNRSRQHPDYGQTYEVRVSNVYTVIYRETLRMSAHHSHTFNFFPGEQFRLHIQITRSGHITVAIPGITKSVILAVEDERTPIEVSYVSFGSRMNAYPVTIYFNCVSSGAAGTSVVRTHRPTVKLGITGEAIAYNGRGEQEDLEVHQQQPDEDAPDGLPTIDNGDDDDEDDDDDGGDANDSHVTELGGSAGSLPNAGSQQYPGDGGAPSKSTGSCPVCPKPEKCEVVVKACSDTSKDLLMQPSRADGEKQKYFFYFNVYLSRKGEKGSKAAALDAPPLGTANQVV